MNDIPQRRRRVTDRQKVDKISEKLIKAIKFEFEVQKGLSNCITDLHKKRLRELQRCLS